jgi:hypothetical protein
MNRIQRGFRLLGDSWEVLKADRELLVLPVIAFVCFLIVAASFGAGVFAVGGFSEGGMGPATYVLLAGFYFVAYFIGIFFNAALIGAATIRLEGGDPTIADGLALAYRRVGRIAAWAAISATVGLILRALEERAGILVRIVISLIGAAWSAITFFVVPVLLYEERSAPGAVKRSAEIFKQRWGEEFTGSGSLALGMFLLLVPLGGVVYLLTYLSVPAAVVVGVVAIGILGAAFAAMNGIFAAALYRYAVKGEVSWGFSGDDLQGAFRRRRSAGL